jgi:hypothetical protein
MNVAVTAEQIPATEADAITWCQSRTSVWPGGGDGVVVDLPCASPTVPFGRWVIRDASGRPIDVVTTAQLAIVYPGT